MSVETMNGMAWAVCRHHGCTWEGPIRGSYGAARNDEGKHGREAHTKAKP